MLSKHCLQTLVCAAMGPVAASCPWFMFCMLRLGMKPGHPQWRRAFRAVFEQGDPSSLCPAAGMTLGGFLMTGNHVNW